MIVTSTSPADLGSVATHIIDTAGMCDLTRACVCTLSGDLGAGKTTLTKEIARQLGITETVHSPTFVIRKRYVTNHPVIKQLIHIDAYRLTSGSELQKIRFDEDLLQPHTLVCIEWPEQVTDLDLKPDIAVQLRHRDATTREITVLP